MVRIVIVAPEIDSTPSTSGLLDELVAHAGSAPIAATVSRITATTRSTFSAYLTGMSDRGREALGLGCRSG